MENNEKRKVGTVTVAATAGLGVAGAMATLIAWGASLAGVQLPEPVVAALTVVLGAVGTLIGGWSVKPSGAHVADR